MAGWRTDIIVDQGTFGSSKACSVLVDLMNQNMISIYEKHRVLANLTKANLTYKNIALIPDRKVRIKIAKLSLTNDINLINNYKYPTKFLSFYKNVLSYIHNKYILDLK